MYQVWSRAEEVFALLDGHIQYFGDVPPGVGHLQRFLVVARALADRAGRFDIGHEVETGGDQPLAGTLLTAPALHIEAEAAHAIAARLSFGRIREQAPNVVVEADIGGRV